MNSTPPFVRQEQSDSCAIACLRMILAAQQIESTETDLIQAASMEPGGLDPEELSRLARRHGVQAAEYELDRSTLFALIRQERFPIVYLHRGPIDRVRAVHAVIPSRVSRQYVTFLDPLRGERRVTIRKFEAARRLVGRWVVVWEAAEPHQET